MLLLLSTKGDNQEISNHWILQIKCFIIDDTGRKTFQSIQITCKESWRGGGGDQAVLYSSHNTRVGLFHQTTCKLQIGSRVYSTCRTSGQPVNFGCCFNNFWHTTKSLVYYCRILYTTLNFQYTTLNLPYTISNS